jgi:branched-chain amino acid transport system substrate-binding protein
VSEFQLANQIVIGAQKIGGKKLAVLYCAEAPVCAQEVAPIEKAAKSVGVQVVFTAAVRTGQPSYTAECLAAKDHGADSMFIADAAPPTEQIALNCSQQGYVPHQISDDGAFSQVFSSNPGMEGMVGSMDNYPFFDTGIAAAKTMHQAFSDYEPSVLKDPSYGDSTVSQWTTGLMIGEGATAGKVGTTNPLTPDALTNGMYTLAHTNLDGMTPTLTFTPGQAQVNRCWFWSSVSNKQWTTPFGFATTCGPPAAPLS